MKLQCVITSYCRPKYLEPCLESMRAGGEVELYVVDGGSDDGTRAAIRRLADGWHFMEDNPGADVLKNEGIERFVTNPTFVCTSDDFLYPPDWAATVQQQFHQLNGGDRKFAMMACPTDLVIERHTNPYGVNGGVGYHYKWYRDLEIMPTSISMVAGTMMDTEATRRVGLFPVYGKTGQGDIAISRCFAAIKMEVGYFRQPVLEHIGRRKKEDYPDYTRDWDADDAIYQQRARQHQPVVTA